MISAFFNIATQSPKGDEKKEFGKGGSHDGI
jgi:hypothetical protein